MTSWIVEYGATTDKRHCATRLLQPLAAKVLSISFSPTFPDEPNLAWVIAICCTAWKSRPEVVGRGAGMPGPRKAFVGLIAPFFHLGGWLQDRGDPRRRSAKSTVGKFQRHCNPSVFLLVERGGGVFTT